MEPSKVYFTNMRTDYDNPLTVKLSRLIKKAGIDAIDFADRFVAIKVHFGEPGNLSFIRPNFAYTVAETIREMGGRPFLTDCNTLYPGYRKNALDHLETAARNGFSPASTGCQNIIADGLKGLDETLVPVKGGKHVKFAKIGQAIMDADVFVSLTHFKGHESVGFGGTLKNIGMGSGSRAGKMEQHYDGKPSVDEALCRGCRQCINSARTARFPMANGTLQGSITTAASAVGAASAPVTSTQSPTMRATATSSSAKNRGICMRRSAEPASFPHQSGHAGVAQLRLPPRQRYADHPGRRHVRLVRSGRP
jgi:uncharacterized Fe-S center protein